MRLTWLLAAATLAGAVAALESPAAQAFGSDPFVAPEGRDLPLGARRWVGRGECEGESTMCDDPYAYQYIRRPWYPGYNSGYWVPAEQMRNRYHYSYTGPRYRYHPAWGQDKVLDTDARRHDGAPLK